MNNLEDRLSRILQNQIHPFERCKLVNGDWSKELSKAEITECRTWNSIRGNCYKRIDDAVRKGEFSVNFYDILNPLTENQRPPVIEALTKEIKEQKYKIENQKHMTVSWWLKD